MYLVPTCQQTRGVWGTELRQVLSLCSTRQVALVMPMAYQLILDSKNQVFNSKWRETERKGKEKGKEKKGTVRLAISLSLR